MVNDTDTHVPSKREAELLVALQAVTDLLDTFGSMLHPTPWERHGAERKIAAARLLLSGTNTPATADAGGLPVDLIADFRDAIAIAKHRAEHAGDTARKKRWIEVRGRLDAYVQADRAPATNAAALYTCIGKGGRYELIGTAKAAGTMKDVLVGDITVYRNIDSSILYYRIKGDFADRMEPYTPAAKGTEALNGGEA